MRMRALMTIVVASTGLLLAGCGSLGKSTVNTNAANTGAAQSTGKAAAGGSQGAKKAGLGDTIDVSDLSGVKLAVTLVKVDAKAKSTDGFSEPPAGDQYYAAQVRIKNIGSSAWSDSPSNCLQVKDGKGQTFQTDILSSVSSGPMMAATTNIAPGDSTLGWVVFDVAKGDTVTTVQFTPLSGMGDDTAQWSL